MNCAISFEQSFWRILENNFSVVITTYNQVVDIIGRLNMTRIKRSVCILYRYKITNIYQEKYLNEKKSKSYCLYKEKTNLQKYCMINLQ